MSKLRRKSEDIKPGAPAWMVVYGDMITLVLTFFVLMFSLSTIDIQKFELLISSLQGTWGIMERGPSFTEDPSEIIDIGTSEPDIGAKEDDDVQIDDIYSKLLELFSSQGIEEIISIDNQERGIVIRFADTMLFNRGSAKLINESLEVMSRLADIFEEFDNEIIVEGHTCDLPIRSTEFPSNWELSAIRSVNVVRYFIENKDLDPTRFSAIGYGEYNPLVINSNEENRSQNRRVDIIISR